MEIVRHCFYYSRRTTDRTTLIDSEMFVFYIRLALTFSFPYAKCESLFSQSWNKLIGSSTHTHTTKINTLAAHKALWIDCTAHLVHLPLEHDSLWHMINSY